MLAANVKSAKMKDLTRACKTIEFCPVPPRLLMLFLDHVLQSEDARLGPGDKISIVKNSGGDIRSMLNGAQARAAGYTTGSNKDSSKIDIADAINGYFGVDDPKHAAMLLGKADSSYSDPRYEVMTPEARRKDMLAALFSSIASSRIDREDLAALLDILSRADVQVGRASANRLWGLLKYLDRIIAGGLYERSRKKAIKYSQYSMPWPVMGPIFARSQSTRKILAELAPAVHTSRSTAGSFVLPYFIRFIAKEGIDPVEFAANNFGDGSVGESIAKEIEKVHRN
jgi:replication factor C large subunit